jgi:hypothetical protein
MNDLMDIIGTGPLPVAASHEPLPDGEYDVVVHSAEVATTKSGGKMIKLRLDVEAPTHQGRVLFASLNIRNANEKAEQIGREQLGAVCAAIGIGTPRSTDELVGGRMTVRVVAKADPGYEPRNEIKRYTARKSGAAAAPKLATPKPAASGAPPFLRGGAQ